MAAPRPLIAGNWKMNGLAADGVALARSVAERAAKDALRCDVLVCPPATILNRIAEAMRGTKVAVGGQDCHAKASGAHTGDLSAPMVRDTGATFVIVGHSERRTDHGETDAMVRAKAEAARAAGLTPIVCIGETTAQRDGGETLQVLTRQIKGSVPPGLSGAEVVIAYEPVWAIGTGRTPTVAEIQEAHAHIHSELIGHSGERAADVRVLYGGSLNAGNAKAILAVPGVNGGLIGGASLKADDFLVIASSCP
ncbi:MAG TPA: triose-phosphate isomerase [Alphaproteobacteria bacterium]|nr:triose-phosphate isomerase [Alphaproteobacteria bacterium]